jgi:hypothetical protein
MRPLFISGKTRRMILVTGTKRSGTSMWMQILKEGGYPIFGSAYSAVWEESIREANPQGFWESTFRQGVFYATNPHPRTGEYLPVEAVKRHGVKVFIPGVVRTEYAYIDHVIATMRPWREYVASINRLYALEDEWLAQRPEPEKALEKARKSRGAFPPEVEWWFEWYELIRDMSTRRYPFHWLTYERVLHEPEREIRRVFRWLKGGDLAAAVASVKPSSKTQRDTPTPGDCPLDAFCIEVMDELYDLCNRDLPMTQPFAERLNKVQTILVEQYGAPSRDRKRDDLEES